MIAFATVPRKIFNSKFVAKVIFQSDILCYHVTNTNADMENQKFLHTLFDEYLNHVLVKSEQNHMVRNIQNVELFGKKMVNHFRESVDVILEEVPIT